MRDPAWGWAWSASHPYKWANVPHLHTPSFSCKESSMGQTVVLEWCSLGPSIPIIKVNKKKAVVVHPGNSASAERSLQSFPGTKLWREPETPAEGFLPFSKVCIPREGLHTPGRSPQTRKVCTYQALEWKNLQGSAVFSADSLIICSIEIVKCIHLCWANKDAEQGPPF